MPRPSRWILPKIGGSRLVRRMADGGFTAAARIRTRRLDRMDAAAVQEKQLLKLVRKAADTKFGRDHGFEHVHTVADFQARDGAAALVLSLKAGGTGLNLTAANHVVLYDRWWNPAVEDQARDRAWRIGQTKTVVSHRLVCPGTVDERVE